jgi:hypothetical protein
MKLAKKHKYNVKRMFLKGFVQSFFIVAILLGVGALGYKITMRLWLPKEVISRELEAPEPTPEPITTASVDDISKNLIFCYDEKKEKITKLILEVYHCEKKQLTYITIPMNTQVTMSDTLYKRLIVVQPSIPQIMRLSSISGYFEKDTVFDYGVLIMEDVLKQSISYYTVLPQELYSGIFSEQMEGSGEDETGKEAVEVFTKDYMRFLEEIRTEEELRSYIKELYHSIGTNLSLQDKLKYLDSYMNTSLSNISFERLPGKEYNSGFIPDELRIKTRLEELTAY